MLNGASDNFKLKAAVPFLSYTVSPDVILVASAFGGKSWIAMLLADVVFNASLSTTSTDYTFYLESASFGMSY